MLEATLICGCSRSDIESEESVNLVDKLSQSFFTFIQEGVKAPLQLKCDSEVLYFDSRDPKKTSSKWINEAVPTFFKWHIERVLRDEGKSNVVFELIEGNSAEDFFILQEKGN